MGVRKNPKALYWQELLRAERELFEWAIRETGGVTKAAILLGIDRKYMYERIKLCGASISGAKKAAADARTAAKQQEESEDA